METSYQDNPAVQLANEADKRNYLFEDARYLVQQNQECDYPILMLLYLHRALTADQIFNMSDIYTNSNSLRNRLNTLHKRKVLNSNARHGLGRLPINFYSLSSLGLRIITEDILQVEEYEPELDEDKFHYTLEDLKIRGHYPHHYSLQSWLSDVHGQLEKQQYLHCEWRRFPLFDENDEVRYRPDWLIFNQNEKAERLMEGSSFENPLHIPYLARTKVYEDLGLTPLMSVECDRGSMTRSDLLEKWKMIKEYKELPVESLVMFYPNGSNSTSRHFNIRETTFRAFNEDMGEGRLMVFEGDEVSTADCVKKYLRHNKQLLADEDMIDFELFRKLVGNRNADYIKGNYTLSQGDFSWEDELNIPFEADRTILKEGESNEIQFIYFCYPGWVNPIAKARSLLRWLKEGNLTLFDHASVVLVYPDQDCIERDVHLKDSELVYVAFDEILSQNKWGKALQRISKNRRVTWEEVIL